MALTIDYHNIQVDSVQRNSGLFFGENTQSYWSSKFKANQVFGVFNADRIVAKGVVNLLIDTDIIDMPIVNNSRKPICTPDQVGI